MKTRMTATTKTMMAIAEMAANMTTKNNGGGPMLSNTMSKSARKEDKKREWFMDESDECSDFVRKESSLAGNDFFILYMIRSGKPQEQASEEEDLLWGYLEEYAV